MSVSSTAERTEIGRGALLTTWRPARWVLPALWGAGAALALTALAVFGIDRAGALPLALLCLVAPVLLAIDLKEHRLPDVVTLPTAVLCAVGLLVGGALGGDWAGARRGAVSAVVLTLCFFVLCIASRGALGLGDVKLAFTLGACLGTLGVLEVLLGPFLGLLAALLVGGVLVLARRARMSSAIALGPYLIVGTLVVMFASA